jgi:hypothetical protein
MLVINESQITEKTRWLEEGIKKEQLNWLVKEKKWGLSNHKG